MGRYIEEDEQGNRYIVDDGEDSMPVDPSGMGGGIRSGIENSDDEAILRPLKDILRGPPQAAAVMSDALTYPIRQGGYLAGLKGPFFEDSMPVSKGIAQYLAENGAPRRNDLQQRVLENIIPLGWKSKAAQMVAGAGAGVGQYLAENVFPENDWAQALVPLIGGIAPGMVAKGVTKSAVPQAEAFERGSLGITRAMTKRSEKSLPKSMQGTGQTPIAKAVERARTEGNLNQMVWDPGEGLQSIRELQHGIGEELSQVLSRADAIRGEKHIFPSWNNVEKYIEGLSGTKKESAKKAFAAEKEILIDSALPEIDGSFVSLQAVKEKWNDLAYKAKKAEDFETESLAKAMVRDMKEAIENGVNDLAKVGELPTELENSVKQLNRRWGDYELLRNPLISQEAKSMSDSISKLTPKFATTGGLLALPLYAGAQTGHSAAGLITGAILSALSTDTGKLGAAKVLRGANAIAEPTALNNEALKKLLASTIQGTGSGD